MGLNQIRRIVTGHNKENKAVISMDGMPPNVIELDAAPGVVFHEIWNTDSSPAKINNGEDPSLRPLSLVPPASGSVVRFVDIPPDSQHKNLSEEEAADAFKEIGAGWGPNRKSIKTSTHAQD